MNKIQLEFSPLGTQDRKSFNSKSQALNAYFHTRVSQDVKRKVTNCFIATVQPTGTIAGYYTLASSSVVLGKLPPDTVKKLPRYPSVPTITLGRLAVDLNYAGQGIGAQLLIDALLRAVAASETIASFAILVDAKDQEAADFYAHHGFMTLNDEPLKLFLPLATAKTLFTQ
jgi:predicted GNAT family N-acyltransferase